MFSVHMDRQFDLLRAVLHPLVWVVNVIRVRVWTEQLDSAGYTMTRNG